MGTGYRCCARASGRETLMKFHLYSCTRERRSPRKAARRSRFQRWMCLRSEEHTSELQSRVDHVCRLMLEKKKKLSMTDHVPAQPFSAQLSCSATIVGQT